MHVAQTRSQGLMAKTVRTIGAAPAGEMGWHWGSALSGIALGFRRLWSAYIVAEHQCYPPADGRNWVPVPSAAAAEHGGYVCPECEQHFVPHGELEGQGAQTLTG